MEFTGAKATILRRADVKKDTRKLKVSGDFYGLSKRALGAECFLCN